MQSSDSFSRLCRGRIVVRDGSNMGNYFFPSPAIIPVLSLVQSESPTRSSGAFPTPSASAIIILLSGMLRTASAAISASNIRERDTPITPTSSISASPSPTANSNAGSTNASQTSENAFPLAGIMGIIVACLLFFVVLAVLVYFYYRKQLQVKVVMQDSDQRKNMEMANYSGLEFHQPASAPQPPPKTPPAYSSHISSNPLMSFDQQQHQVKSINSAAIISHQQHRDPFPNQYLPESHPRADIPSHFSGSSGSVASVLSGSTGNGSFNRTNSNASSTILINQSTRLPIPAPRRPSFANTAAASANNDNASAPLSSRGGFVNVPSQPTLLSSSTLINTNREYALPGFLIMDLESSLSLGRRIGKGGAAEVFEAVLIDPAARERAKSPTGKVAVKFMKECTSMTPEENRFSFEQEVTILWSLGYHPHIAKLIGYSTSPQFMTLKLYQCNLLHLLLEAPNLSGQQLFYIAHAISNAMAAAHELGVAHRDLKSVNILMEKIEGVWEAAVADFGLAVIDETKTNVIGGPKKSNIKGLSVKYASPEVFSMYYSPNSGKPTFAFAKMGDVFSYGAILFEILSGRPIWEGVSDDIVQHKVRSGERPRLPLSAPRPGESLKDVKSRKMLADLMHLCWHQNPMARPTFHQIATKLATIDDE